MPVRKVGPNSYQWGNSGKVYSGKGAKAKAERQGRAIYASGYKGAAEEYGAESYKPPASAVANAKRGLKLRKEWGRGGLSPSEAKSQGIDSGVTRARKIASGTVSRHDVRRMSAFNRHRKNYRPDKKMSDGGPTAGTIAWLLWGGTSGVNWAKKKSAAMNAETFEAEYDNCPTCNSPTEEHTEYRKCGDCNMFVCTPDGCGLIAQDSPWNNNWDWLCDSCYRKDIEEGEYSKRHPYAYDAETFEAEERYRQDYMVPADVHKIMEAAIHLQKLHEQHEGSYPEWWKSKLSVVASELDNLVDVLDYKVDHPEEFDAEVQMKRDWLPEIYFFDQTKDQMDIGVVYQGKRYAGVLAEHYLDDESFDAEEIKGDDEEKSHLKRYGAEDEKEEYMVSVPVLHYYTLGPVKAHSEEDAEEEVFNNWNYWRRTINNNGDWGGPMWRYTGLNISEPEAYLSAEDWGGDPDGPLAKALAKARESLKKPQKPLQITRLPDRNQKTLKDFEANYRPCQKCDNRYKSDCECYCEWCKKDTPLYNNIRGEWVCNSCKKNWGEEEWRSEFEADWQDLPRNKLGQWQKPVSVEQLQNLIATTPGVPKLSDLLMLYGGDTPTNRYRLYNDMITLRITTEDFDDDTIVIDIDNDPEIYYQYILEEPLDIEEEDERLTPEYWDRYSRYLGMTNTPVELEARIEALVSDLDLFNDDDFSEIGVMMAALRQQKFMEKYQAE